MAPDHANKHSFGVATLATHQWIDDNMKRTRQVALPANIHTHSMMSVILIALLVTLKIVLCHLNGTLRVADVLFLVLYIRLGLHHALFSCSLLFTDLQVGGVFLTG